VTLKMLQWYGWLALGSLCLKVPLALYVYYYGYLQGDILLASPDGFDYVARGQQHDYQISLFGHWLYEYLNGVVYDLNPHLPIFLVMSLLNVALSLLLPLALWPAAQGLDLKQGERKPYFIGLCTLLLFWPSALWLSSQNLKDMLTALLFSLFLSVFIRAIRPGRQNPLALIGLTLLGTGLLYLIFSVRSYLAAFLLIAIVIHLLFKESRAWMKIAVAVVLVALLLSPVGQGFQVFFSADNNWLLNPAAADDLNRDSLARGVSPVVVNRTPIALLLELPHTLVNPHPSIEDKNIIYQMQVLRSVFLCFTLFFFAVSFWKWKSPLKLFFGLCLFLPFIFYMIVPAFSGPRQSFSSGIDLIYLLLLTLFVQQKWQSQTVGISLGIGIAANNFGLMLNFKDLF
jgi:hypothetical protein